MYRIFKKPLTIICLVLIGYLILTVFFTYPLAANFSRAIVGDKGEAALFLWNLWWVKFALLDLKTNPFYTDYIFYPQGINLALHEFTFLNGLMSIPLQLLFGLTISYNIIAVLSFVLSGLGAYLLINYLTRNKLASFIGGIIFAFCPYKFVHLLGHMDLVTTQWIPFYILFLIRMTKEKEARLYNGILAGLFLLFNALSAYYYFVFLIIFTGFYLVYVRLSDRKLILNSLFLKNFLALIITFFILFLPILISSISYTIKEGRTEPRGLKEALYAADLFSFFVSSDQHFLMGRYLGFNSGEKMAFLGFTVIILTVLAIIKFYKKREVKFWSLTLIIFLLLSLGLYLHVGGRKTIVPLPFFIIYFFPLIKNLRAPGRFIIMAILNCAILSSFFLSFIFDRLKKASQKTFVALAVIALISFEYLSKIPMQYTKAPSVYEHIREDEEDITVLEIPLGWQNSFQLLGADSTYIMYFQTIHEKRTFGGLVSRFPDNRVDYYSNLPVISSIINLQHKKDYVFPADIIEEQKMAENFKNFFKVKYIIIHAPYLDSPVHKYIKDVFSLNKIYEDNKVVAYQISDFK
ncbi:MAG: hypothetical protein KJ593_07665 [Candidatus Omnitrophica bacterium]|nr:hypothetical protein [Candidatus Omnitrophota bacterium]